MVSTPPEIITFGCRLNAYESQVIAAAAETAGLTDAVIVNTCAVTSQAVKQARQTIRRLRRDRPNARIIVTGCAAQTDPAHFAAMPEVDQILGNEEKLRSQSYDVGGAAAPRILVDDIMSVRENAGHLVEGFGGKVRGFVQIQQGCDHRCTFCIIPFARGNSRSVPIGVITRQIRAMVDAGCREIVLSGVDITAFGADLPGRPGLGQLVRRLLALVPELPRLRLSSLDPVEIDEDLWRLIAEEERLMPHLHLSLQAGDDMILKRMKRRHSRADAIAACRRAEALRPGVALGADLIAGFPTESDAMFRNTFDLIADCGLVHIHVFPYSARPGTVAARMPPVPDHVVHERAAHLREAAALNHQAWLDAQIGRKVSVLVENGARGHTPHFALVHLGPDARKGDIVTAHLRARAGAALIGEAVMGDVVPGIEGAAA